ncbi:MAG: ABC transporter permease [Eubacteriales bacterium]|nr:ABC transporter permease [Eubacteriales bacterium]
MKKICPDVKNSICNWRLFAGILVLFCTALFSAQDQVKQLLTVRFSEVPGWFSAFCFFADHPNTLMVIPIAAPFVFAAEIEEDFRSRYVLFVCARIDRRQYYTGKILGLMFSGGFVVCGAMLLLLFTACLGFDQVTWIQENGEGMLIFYGRFILYLVCGFLNGALWALIGGLAALASHSIYAAYAFPFVLYYVLSIFQERYYGSALFLSPRYWATPFSSLGIGSIGILLLLFSAVAAAFVFVIKKRLERI